MKIRNKIFLIFLSVSFVLTVVGMASVLFFANSSLRDSINKRLESNISSKASYIDVFLKQQKQNNFILSKDHHWSDLLHQLYDGEPPKGFSKNEFISHAASVLKDNVHDEHYHIFLLDKDANIVLSTKKSLIGENKSQESYFVNSKENLFVGNVYYEEDDNKFVYPISSPVFDVSSGDYLGSLVSLVDMDNLFFIVSSGIDLEKTREVYLINREGYMLTPSLFVENSVLNQKVDDLNSKNCFDATLLNDPSDSDIEEFHRVEHEIVLYSNYNNQNVLGTHAYLPSVGWCLIAEIGENEVLTPLDKLLYIFLAAGIVLLLITFLVSNWIGLIIGGPIEKLRKSVEIVEQGNLDYNIDLGTVDEVGKLSKAFSSMISSVKKSREDIDKKVDEQTKDIMLKKENIEKQQSAILNILEDVELEKEKTRLEKEKADTLLRSIGDGVLAINKDLEIILFNEAAENISGFSSLNVVGQKYHEVFKIIDEKTKLPADDFITKVLKAEKVLEVPDSSLLIKKDGSSIPVAISASPVKDSMGEVIGCTIIFRDVTRRREIDKMKSEFVSIASHQLRTPLTGIQWVSERLLKVSSKLPEKEREYVNDVYLSAKRLSRLVDDLLSVSRIEGGRVAVVPEKIDAVEFLVGYFEEIKPLAVQKNINFNLIKEDEKIDMFTDRSALQNIYQSLVSNAIEYTPEGGKVTVKIKKKNKKVLLEVEDNGIGIPKKDQPTIFEKFTRGANAAAVKTDGTGFGLYIAKQTTDLLGGDISFVSEENKGTTFFVELPIKSKPVNVTKS